MSFDTSWLDRSRNTIAQGCLTNSKKPEGFLLGLYPTHIKHGHGCYVYDANDKKYIDFLGGLGSNLFGYGNDLIAQPVLKHLYNGANHSFPTIHEVEAAEMVKETIPFVERVKFLKTGSDACNAAIRFARAYTGKSMVLSEGYHGWGDEFVNMTPPAKGVADGKIYPLSSHCKELDGVAAVILEPVMLDYSKERIEHLKWLREECTRTGTILIFDEVITALRWPKGSVSQYYGIKPDLICLGKALGGGYSLAAVAGRADILDDPEVFVSSTYAGEVPALVAGKRAMEILQQKSDYNIEYLWEKGQEFMDEFNAMGGIQMTGYPTRGGFTGTPEERALFCQEMAKADVLFHPGTWFFNFPMIKIMDDVLNIIDIVKRSIKAGKVRLEYKLPTTPFAAKVRSK
jgi:glutamate-1-semialdehyde 2,1-aminomutase